MKDRSVQYPNRYKMTQVSDGVVELVAQPGTVTEAGTVLNKANLLSDATASAIGGLPSDPTVNDALNRLCTLITSAQNTANGRTQTQIVSYVGTGTCGESNPTSITFNFVPKVAIFISEAGEPSIAIWVSGSKFAYFENDYSYSPAPPTSMSVTLSGKKLSYYNSSRRDPDPSYQFNSSGKKYFVAAFA